MIKGSIAGNESGKYQLQLENGASFSLEKEFLPPALQAVGRRFHLLFSGEAASCVSPEDARTLLNDLLGA